MNWQDGSDHAALQEGRIAQARRDGAAAVLRAVESMKPYTGDDWFAIVGAARAAAAAEGVKVTS